jgi:hypothetical protein
MLADRAADLLNGARHQWIHRPPVTVLAAVAQPAAAHASVIWGVKSQYVV